MDLSLKGSSELPLTKGCPFKAFSAVCATRQDEISTYIQNSVFPEADRLLVCTANPGHIDDAFSQIAAAHEFTSALFESTAFIFQKFRTAQLRVSVDD